MHGNYSWLSYLIIYYENKIFHYNNIKVCILFYFIIIVWPSALLNFMYLLVYL
jgi:hypothetical protein